ncbi:hypothetical protein HORIV_59120 [Vreelandella olivaria]|uniref:Dihydroxy-acid/6-phosphogluconate dehydratase C-terminal domain-containing protein n=1 Tax=Vreelandella olivaria TaxID=390919 RepID=A0ABN5XA45_9GAMM|nr:hypothetical protein HORIV_59120 [Halomonas olivaria]
MLRRLGEADRLPFKDALTVNGKTLWQNVQDAPLYNDEVIRPLDNPLTADGGICVVRGNLAPNGAVLKPSAATAELMQHRGRAVVFEDFDDYKARINDPDLDVEANDILVMKHCGPRGYHGMAEVGNMGLPPKILAQGITDMVRISDARMSGTAYGTVVLHVARKPPLVARWRRYATATGSNSTAKVVDCTWNSAMKSWRRAWPRATPPPPQR